MKNIFIKTKGDCKIFKANECNLEIDLNDEVIFEIDQFQDIGIISEASPEVDKELSKGDELVTVIRKLTTKDKERILELKSEAKGMLERCREKIEKHNLEMSLLDADLSYDGKKLTFYFTAPGRVDFRSLVPDLASTFKKLIRLQQVGNRDKAKCIDAIGRCGRNICCKAFLRGDLDNITPEMAAEQNLGQAGSNRVSGICGKLQCCLRYENESYKDLKKAMPQIGAKIKLPEGEGVVISQNVIKNMIRVELIKDRRIVEVDC